MMAIRIYRGAKRIGVYLSHQGEISLAPLIEHALKQGKCLYLPLVSTNMQNRTLSFYPLNASTRLKKNRYGISEPVSKRAKISPKQLDLVWVPLVAFDAKCRRIGMGGGYYDRTFKYKQTHVCLAPKLMGVGYEWQRQKTVESKPWDIWMDTIVSDQHRYRRGH